MKLARWKRPIIAIVKAVVAIVVIWAVGRHVLRTWNDVSHHSLALRIHPLRLGSAALLYLAGLSCAGRFYELVLGASPTPLKFFPAVRAYLISHLGKYVPGKAMVVVMRAGLSAPYGVKGSTAAVATFYETLVMMAAGGLIAALGFAMAGPSPGFAVKVPYLGTRSIPLFLVCGLLGLGLGLAILTVVLPLVFRRLVAVVRMPFPRVGVEALPRITNGLLLRGLGWTALSWLFLGASQVETACALASLDARQVVGLLPLVCASVALATVAGFVVAVLPGGIGVREGVLMYALAPALGEDLAVVAALLLRLVWVVAELVAAAVLLPLGRPPKPLPAREEITIDASAMTS